MLAYVWCTCEYLEVSQGFFLLLLMSHVLFHLDCVCRAAPAWSFIMQVEKLEAREPSNSLVPSSGMGMAAPPMEAGVLLHNIQRIIQVWLAPIPFAIYYC